LAPIKPNFRTNIIFIALEVKKMASVTPNLHGSSNNHGTGISGTALSQIETFATFGCNVPITNPQTPDLITQQTLPASVQLKEFVRKFFSSKLQMPDGSELEIWAFEDPLDKDTSKRFQFPSAPIVVAEGDLVHTKLEASKNSHTIHHHGIEPTSMNDGVGHTSFEVAGSYTYQWQATDTGTFFYHCHKNTVLHAEMGMYGLLIIVPQDHKRSDGRFNAFAPISGDVPLDITNNTSFKTPDDLRCYDVEADWVPDEMDPRWHSLNHNAGLCGEDAGLNNFNPVHFLVSGVPYYQQGSRQGQPFAIDPKNLELVNVTANLGETVLVRFVHAGYTVLTIDVPNALEVVVIEDTGRQLGGKRSPYSAPFRIPINAAIPAPLPLTPARRSTALVRAKAPGRYEFKLTFYHWITGKPLGIAIPTITFF
jgi:plastocyanin